MSPLLRTPFGADGKVHEITAVPAGWRFVAAPETEWIMKRDA